MDSHSEYGITVLYPPESRGGSEDALPSPFVFDLVAIHGLNGHAFGTWTHKQTQVMWLRDLLPGLLAHVRIMTYGYNADFRNFTADQSLRNIAKKLLSELVDARRTEEESRRPIVLLCHSLGGIVAKKAILLSCSLEEKQVQDAVYGIFFLATPHNGSSLANIGRIISNIVSACTPIHPAKALFRTLRPESEALLEITEDFARQSTRLHLVSFYEMEMTSIGFFKKMIVERRSAVLNLPNEVTIGQYANHCDIARFKSASDRNLRPIVYRLGKLKSYIGDQGRSMSLREINAEVSEIDGLLSLGRVFAYIPDGTETGTFSIFELPFPPCRTFQGRDDLLDRMEQYFDSNEEATAQLVYAICGLGGSGKTQTALKFATRRRSRYKSGVIFINASSPATIVADFDRVCESMRLGNSSNKFESVRRWLSDIRHSEWLLIFDNADDLESVCVSDWFPNTTWGHIIITSRDESAIGLVGHTGWSLEPLKPPEAVNLLLDKSGIRASSREERYVYEIADLLGYLPLALDQAGAFMRARHKSFADYIRLFRTQQDELLKFEPRLSGYDKTVLTAWNVNFKQVEDDSENAASLLLLFCFLEPGDISENMLRRGCTPQKRWDNGGNIGEVDAQESGVSSYLVRLITEEMTYDAAIEKLLSFSLIRRNNDFNESRSISVHPLVQYCASHRVSKSKQNTWRLQAILLVCHSFPRSQYIEDRFMRTGRAQIPHVARILDEYDKLALDAPVTHSEKRTIASMLLAASRFADKTWKENAIDRARQLLENDDDRHLQAHLVLRQSALSRMYNRKEDSQQILESLLHATRPDDVSEPDQNVPGNALRGELIISYAENLIQGAELRAAKKELLNWHPSKSENLSLMEGEVLRAKNFSLARILREEGNFQQALLCFETLHQGVVSDDHAEHTGRRRIILSNICDMYCELDRPADAIVLIQPELTHLGDAATIGSGRHLKASLAEAQILAGKFSEAAEELWALKKVSDAVVNPDVITLNIIFRTWCGLARLSHHKREWSLALSHWTRALEAGRLCKWDRRYPLNIVRLSIGHVHFEMGNEVEASGYQRDAEESIAQYGIEYWTVGLGTYWYQYVRKQLLAFDASKRESCTSK